MLPGGEPLLIRDILIIATMMQLLNKCLSLSFIILTMIRQPDFDVIIVGGSYAGLSAAMSLGRSRRKTLVIDNGKPCNEQTPHSHNFLTQDGKTPGEISAIAKQQVQHYETISFYEGTAITGQKSGAGFEISTNTGKSFTAKKLIFASGIQDQLPEIPGVRESWGISLIHCPYCHGYEFRNKKTALWANGDRALHLASLISNLTKDLIILTNGKAELTDDQIRTLDKNNIQLLQTPIAAFEHDHGRIKNVVFNDASKLDFEAVYAALPFVQHSSIPVSLGCALTPQGHIQLDNMQRTTVPGVFACGDNSSPMRSVANAVATGNFAGAAVNAELSQETFLTK
jgi:thioredoxin reductase